MPSVEDGAPPQATTETQTIRWSSKLKRYVSSTSAFAIKNHGKLDLALRLSVFVFSLIAVVITVTAKQHATIHVSPVTTIRAEAKFSQFQAFIYSVSVFSVVILYSLVTGYKSYSALKKQQPSSINKMLHMVLLDSFILAVATSAAGAGGGISYQALKGNPHTHWMKICNIFGTFCHHLAIAGVILLLATATLLMLVWLTIYAIVKKVAGTSS
ncbi:hypothetical protein QVD17_13857 [Tagetes erecta]|uniref:CASP-like protein n=1 Tax=Tagetes erecta TaxID=13708 RepID=A0AAD8KWG4_TARER|nr:hypothetical protein QVD17_13857 [Tagetes erecta]